MGHMGGLTNQTPSRPIFLCDPVVLESICYRTRAKRLINESNTTGELRKVWTGAPGADNTEPVFQIPVGLPSLERGRRVKKNSECVQSIFFA